MDRAYDVVLLDALGTLLDLEPPGPHLVAALAARGVTVGEDLAHRAMVAEMTYYRAHCDGAGTPAALEDLRDRCAAIVARELGAAAAALPATEVRAAMLDAFRFPAYPEVPAVLRALRATGARLVVVSNWDVSLHDALRAAGLDGLLDGAVSSAETGVAKPDPALLHAALGLVPAVAPDRVLMVGDTPPDVLAARAAGVAAVLVDRFGAVAADDPLLTGPPRAHHAPDLRGLPELVAGPGPYPG
ncbi:HAD-IA family hydrolase [Conexibacter sp. W3-3-2]|uniref:HAD family hydrolase n=1 Tax=Conexibacter sp. W3-3-2 TaxID=2675227 RepID=UPI0012B97F3F|nr:HAD-IA family hydrolase [Conexibacter sp. W3-3-2]MTD45624.1 HAD-IA family hydrolase [Conexibacter sp. W3-3-2]